MLRLCGSSRAFGILLTLCSFLPFQDKKIRIFMIGDSTMSVKEVYAYPETGWGMPFAHFFDSMVTVDNRAKNGRSSKSFREEGLWQGVLNQLAPGDYVFIQFGHNDESVTKRERYSTPGQYKANLLRYVAETRSKGAFPVLLTPVTRRKFDSLGNIQETHPVYADLVRNVARETATPLIDMDKDSRQLLQRLGPDDSKFLYMHLDPGEHPNYPLGQADDTHFTELGARKMAELALADLRKLNTGLSRHIVTSKLQSLER
jgi:lysophospholipase L1-like esterase